MRRRWGQLAALTALLIAVTLAGAVLWLFYHDGPPARVAYRLDLGQLRVVAGQVAGPSPTHIEVEIVSHDAVPKIAMVTGTDWGKVDLIRTSYRIVGPGRSVVVDTGYDEAGARRLGADRGAYGRVQQALSRANLIVFTHEHEDHLGGAFTSPDLARFAPRLLLTAEQLASSEGPPWPVSVRRPSALGYDMLHAVAPGVVLIKAPGHTPGSQMIYVRRADGRQFLFMGDVASMADNVRIGRQRSRYVTSFVSGGDRAAVGAQVSAIAELSSRHTELVLVPGHDAVAIGQLVRKGLLTAGFRVPAR